MSRLTSHSIIRDDQGDPLMLFHGSRDEIESFDPGVTSDGCLHFGTHAQASMRTHGAGANLIPVFLEVRNLRRVRDMGGNWRKKMQDSKAKGFDGIVYLNRYEGLSTETVFGAFEKGQDLDLLTDAQFRKAVPEASDSYIVFSADQVLMALGFRDRPLPGIPCKAAASRERQAQ